MISFLKQSKKLLNAKSESCIIIIGNESCDLDSAVSAISLAHFYSVRQKRQHLGKTEYSGIIEYLPVLNIPREDYPLKSEVKFLFNKYSITDECLTFRNDLSDRLISLSKFILVDHHVSPFSTKCIEVFDHRPLDIQANFPPNSISHIELVGSCATLIGDLILQHLKCDDMCKDLYFDIDLIRNAIVLDTVNFSKEAARATSKDHEVCDTIEQLLRRSSNLEDREKLFGTLCTARADVGELTSYLLLKRDLKIITSSNEKVKIALPGFPLLVQNFVQRPDASAAVLQFAEENNCPIVLLMGMYVHKDTKRVERDIGVLILDKNISKDLILHRILQSDNPNLCLERYTDIEFLDGDFFKQKNIKATRKQILPIVKDALEKI